MRENTEYIVVEWLDDLPGIDRYGFATAKHAAEMGEQVRCLDTFLSLETAAHEVDRLNQLQAALAAREAVECY
jgi:hypothetical protein